MSVQFTNVDHIAHSILHNRISLDEGIDKCKDLYEVEDLIWAVTACDNLDQERYESFMDSLFLQRKLARFEGARHEYFYRWSGVEADATDQGDNDDNEEVLDDYEDSEEDLYSILGDIGVPFNAFGDPIGIGDD